MTGTNTFRERKAAIVQTAEAQLGVLHRFALFEHPHEQATLKPPPQAVASSIIFIMDKLIHELKAQN
jgi:hypothetical protein